MPLPLALQARLQKRGLINDTVSESSENDVKKANQQVNNICPNAWNPHHTCVTFCEEHWIKATHNVRNHKSRSQKPLPPGWFLVPDPDHGDRSYYWNVNTNLVSWLHPQDPNAEISLPKSVLENTNSDQMQTQMQPSVPGEDESDEQKSKGSESSRKIPPKIKTGKHPSLMKVQREKERSLPYKKKNSQKDDLDPMDPAAYSDVPRGNWSSGLKEDTDVKTGVDTTANGPLFQQRPYPSPGEVLRRNQKKN